MSDLFPFYAVTTENITLQKEGNSHMSDNDPYAEGREAHDCGKSISSNPYELDTDDYQSWDDGWTVAHEEED